MDLCQLHRSMYDCDMPATCLDATSPDNAIMSPQLAQWVTQIQVRKQGYFDTHHVVSFQL